MDTVCGGVWSNLYSIGGGCLDTRSGRGYSAATCASGSLRRGAQSTNIGVKKRPGVLRRTGLFFDEAVGFSLTYFKIVFIEKKTDEKINKIKDFLT